MQVVLWDTANMEKNDIMSMSRSYFTQCVGMILVYKKGDQSSLFELRKWVNRVQESEWCDSVVLSLWSHDMGTDCDEVSPELRDSFIDTLNIPHELVFEVNVAEEGRNVTQSYEQLVAAVHCKLSPHSNGHLTQPQSAGGNIVVIATENGLNIQQTPSSTKKKCFC